MTNKNQGIVCPRQPSGVHIFIQSGQVTLHSVTCVSCVTLFWGRESLDKLVRGWSVERLYRSHERSFIRIALVASLVQMSSHVSHVLSGFQTRILSNIEAKLMSELSSHVCKSAQSAKNNRHLQQQSITKQNWDTFEITALEVAFNLE